MRTRDALSESAVTIFALVFFLAFFGCNHIDTIQVGVMDQMIAMPDGVRLATDVYSATGSGPWPVILARTPYDRKESFNVDRGTTFGNAGVVYIVQDVRGQYGSEGTGDFFGSDESDGPAMINLIAQQSWCNGRIALLGNSAF